MQRSCADVNSPYKRQCWTYSGGPLVNSVFWGAIVFRKPSALPVHIVKIVLTCFSKIKQLQKNFSTKDNVSKGLEFWVLISPDPYRGKWNCPLFGRERWIAVHRILRQKIHKCMSTPKSVQWSRAEGLKIQLLALFRATRPNAALYYLNPFYNFEEPCSHAKRMTAYRTVYRHAILPLTIY